jgi:hypothetical protein
VVRVFLPYQLENGNIKELLRIVLTLESCGTIKNNIGYAVQDV